MVAIQRLGKMALSWLCGHGWALACARVLTPPPPLPLLSLSSSSAGLNLMGAFVGTVRRLAVGAVWGRALRVPPPNQPSPAARLLRLPLKGGVMLAAARLFWLSLKGGVRLAAARLFWLSLKGGVRLAAARLFWLSLTGGVRLVVARLFWLSLTGGVMLAAARLFRFSLTGGVMLAERGVKYVALFSVIVHNRGNDRRGYERLRY